MKRSGVFGGLVGGRSKGIIFTFVLCILVAAVVFAAASLVDVSDDALTEVAFAAEQYDYSKPETVNEMAANMADISYEVKLSMEGWDYGDSIGMNSEYANLHTVTRTSALPIGFDAEWEGNTTVAYYTDSSLSPDSRVQDEDLVVDGDTDGDKIILGEASADANKALELPFVPYKAGTYYLALTYCPPEDAGEGMEQTFAQQTFSVEFTIAKRELEIEWVGAGEQDGKYIRTFDYDGAARRVLANVTNAVPQFYNRKGDAVEDALQVTVKICLADGTLLNTVRDVLRDADGSVINYDMYAYELSGTGVDNYVPLEKTFAESKYTALLRIEPRKVSIRAKDFNHTYGDTGNVNGMELVADDKSVEVTSDYGFLEDSADWWSAFKVYAFLGEDASSGYVTQFTPANGTYYTICTTDVSNTSADSVYKNYDITMENGCFDVLPYVIKAENVASRIVWGAGDDQSHFPYNGKDQYLTFAGDDNSYFVYLRLLDGDPNYGEGVTGVKLNATIGGGYKDDGSFVTASSSAYVFTVRQTENVDIFKGNYKFDASYNVKREYFIDKIDVSISANPVITEYGNVAEKDKLSWTYDGNAYFISEGKAVEAQTKEFIDSADGKITIDVSTDAVEYTVPATYEGYVKISMNIEGRSVAIPELTNYKVTLNAGAHTVTKRKVQIKWENSLTFIYNGTDQSKMEDGAIKAQKAFFQTYDYGLAYLLVRPLKGGERANYTTAAPFIDAGTYTFYVVGFTNAGENGKNYEDLYELADDEGTPLGQASEQRFKDGIIIKPREVYISANAVSGHVYGETFGELSWSYSDSSVDYDTQQFVPDYDKNFNVRLYGMTAGENQLAKGVYVNALRIYEGDTALGESAEGDYISKDGNYTVHYASADLTVVQREITLTLNALLTEYGDPLYDLAKAEGAYELAAGGNIEGKRPLANEHTDGDVFKLIGDAVVKDGAYPAVGKYPISVQLLDDNYKLTIFADGELKATLNAENTSGGVTNYEILPSDILAEQTKADLLKAIEGAVYRAEAFEQILESINIQYFTGVASGLASEKKTFDLDTLSSKGEVWNNFKLYYRVDTAWNDASTGAAGNSAWNVDAGYDGGFKGAFNWEDWSENAPRFTNAGKYRVYFAIVADNHTPALGEDAYIEFEIAKKAVFASTTIETYYGDRNPADIEGYAPTFDFAGFEGEDEAVIKTADFLAKFTISISEYKQGDPQGEYDITIDISDTGVRNYSFSQAKDDGEKDNKLHIRRLPIKASIQNAGNKYYLNGKATGDEDVDRTIEIRATLTATVSINGDFSYLDGTPVSDVFGADEGKIYSLSTSAFIGDDNATMGVGTYAICGAVLEEYQNKYDVTFEGEWAGEDDNKGSAGIFTVYPADITLKQGKDTALHGYGAIEGALGGHPYDEEEHDAVHGPHNDMGNSYDGDVTLLAATANGAATWKYLLYTDKLSDFETVDKAVLFAEAGSDMPKIIDAGQYYIYIEISAPDHTPVYIELEAKINQADNSVVLEYDLGKYEGLPDGVAWVYGAYGISGSDGDDGYNAFGYASAANKETLPIARFKRVPRGEGENLPVITLYRQTNDDSWEEVTSPAKYSAGWFERYGATLPAGSYEIRYYVEGNANYTALGSKEAPYKMFGFKVAKKQLTVTVGKGDGYDHLQNFELQYGDDIAGVFGVKYDGFVNGETFDSATHSGTPEFVTAMVGKGSVYKRGASHAGEAYTVSLAHKNDGEFCFDNYTIDEMTGTMTIVSRNITVDIADNVFRTADGSHDFTDIHAQPVYHGWNGEAGMTDPYFYAQLAYSGHTADNRQSIDFEDGKIPQRVGKYTVRITLAANDVEGGTYYDYVFEVTKTNTIDVADYDITPLIVDVQWLQPIVAIVGNKTAYNRVNGYDEEIMTYSNYTFGDALSDDIRFDSEQFAGQKALYAVITATGTGSVMIELTNKNDYLLRDPRIAAVTATTITLTFSVRASNIELSVTLNSWQYGEHSFGDHQPKAEAPMLGDAFKDAVILYTYATVSDSLKAQEPFDVADKALTSEQVNGKGLVWGSAQPVYAGRYIVRAELIAGSDYDGAEAYYIFDITKHVMQLPALNASELTYDGTEQSVWFNMGADDTAFIDDHFDYQYGGRAEKTEDKLSFFATTAGEYIITVTLLDENNHEWEGGGSDKKEIKFRIKQAANEITDLADIPSVVYGETASYLQARAKFGTIVYYWAQKGEFASGDLVKSWTPLTDGAFPKNVGEYFVKAEVIETSDYAGDVKYASLTIVRATLTVKANAVEVIYGDEAVYSFSTEGWKYDEAELSAQIAAGEGDVLSVLSEYIAGTTGAADNVTYNYKVNDGKADTLDNYTVTVSEKSAEITVKKRTLVIQISDISMTFDPRGDAESINRALLEQGKWTVVDGMGGLADGDSTADIVISITVGAGVEGATLPNVGRYVLSGELAASGGNKNNNYSVTVRPGTIEIVRLSLEFESFTLEGVDGAPLSLVYNHGNAVAPDEMRGKYLVKVGGAEAVDRLDDAYRSALRFMYSGTCNSGEHYALSETAPTLAGSYTVTIALTEEQAGNYTLSGDHADAYVISRYLVDGAALLAKLRDTDDGENLLSFAYKHGIAHLPDSDLLYKAALTADGIKDIVFVSGKIDETSIKSLLGITLSTAQTNAGTYGGNSFVLNDKDNYAFVGVDAAQGILPFDFEIVKAFVTMTFTHPELRAWKYDGTLHLHGVSENGEDAFGLEVKVNGEKADGEELKLFSELYAYWISKDMAPMRIEDCTKVTSANLDRFTGVGIYYIYVELPDSANYGEAYTDGYAQYTVQQREICLAVDIDGVAGGFVGGKYDGTTTFGDMAKATYILTDKGGELPEGVDFEALARGISVNAAYEGTGFDGTTSWRDDAIAAAGRYTVTFTLGDDEYAKNFKLVSVDGEALEPERVQAAYIISRREQNYENVVPATLYYTGSAQSASAALKDVEGYDSAFSLSEDVYGTDAGSYDITLVLKDTANNYWCDHTASQYEAKNDPIHTFRFIIASSYVTDVSLTGYTFTVNGEGKTIGGEVTGWTYGDVITEISATVTVTLAKTAGGESIGTLTLAGGYVLEYRRDGADNVVSSIAGNAAAGTYSVTARVPVSNNIANSASSDGELHVTIAKREVRTPTLQKGTQTYNGTQLIATFEGFLSGVMSFGSVAQGASAGILADGTAVVRATDVGEYKINILLDENHAWAAGQADFVIFVIEKKDLTEEVNDLDITIAGDDGQSSRSIHELVESGLEVSYGSELSLASAAGDFAAPVEYYWKADDSSGAALSAAGDIDLHDGTWKLWSEEEHPAHAGNYKVVADIRASANYDEVQAMFSLTIARARLTVTPKDIRVVYGESAIYDYTVDGWKENDASEIGEAALLSHIETAEVGYAVGNAKGIYTYKYAILPGSSEPEDGLSDYALVAAETAGNIEVVSRELGIEILPQSMYYDPSCSKESIEAQLAAADISKLWKASETVGMGVYGEDKISIILTLGEGLNGAVLPNAGSYTLIGKATEGGDNANYTILISNDSTLTIDPVKLTFTGFEVEGKLVYAHGNEVETDNSFKRYTVSINDGDALDRSAEEWTSSHHYAAFEFEYAGTTLSGEPYALSNVQPTEAGSYTVSVAVKDGYRGNYIIEGGSAVPYDILPFEIDRDELQAHLQSDHDELVNFTYKHNTEQGPSADALYAALADRSALSGIIFADGGALNENLLKEKLLSASVIKRVNTGTYDAIGLTLIDGYNYKFKGLAEDVDSTTLSYTIGKADVEISFDHSQRATWSYDGTLHAEQLGLNVTVNGAPADPEELELFADNYTYWFSVGEDMPTRKDQCEQIKGSEYAKYVKVGVYHVFIDLPELNNYNEAKTADIEHCATYEVTKRAVAIAVDTDETAGGFISGTYDGRRTYADMAQATYAISNAGDDLPEGVDFAALARDIKVIRTVGGTAYDGTAWGVAGAAKAGRYSVSIMLDEADESGYTRNFSLAEPSTADLLILRAAYHGENIKPNSVYYDREDHALAGEVMSGVDGFNTVYRIADGQADTQRIDRGTYSFDVTLMDKNYYWCNGDDASDAYKADEEIRKDAELSFEILAAYISDVKLEKLDIDINGKTTAFLPGAMGSWTYRDVTDNFVGTVTVTLTKGAGGEDIGAITLTADEFVLEYSRGGGAYLANKPSEAGSWTARASVKPSDNFANAPTGGSIGFDINKYELDAPALKTSEFTYTGALVSTGFADESFDDGIMAIISVIGEKRGGQTIYALLDGQWTVGATIADRYAVAIRIKDSNYKWRGTNDDTVLVRFEIVKASNSFTSVFEDIDATYGEVVTPFIASAFGELRFYFAERGDFVSAQDVSDWTEWKDSAPINAGDYYIKAEADGTDDYLTVTAYAVLHVAKATLTVKANGESVTYGDGAPNYSFTAEGWQYDDETAIGIEGLRKAVSITGDYHKGAAVKGKYAVTLAAIGTLDNYELSLVDAALTVAQKELSVRLTPQSGVYNGRTHFASSADEYWEAAGFIDGDGKENIRVKISIVDAHNAPIQPINADVYLLFGEAADDDAGNYRMTFEHSFYTIRQRTLTVEYVTAGNIIYGGLTDIAFAVNGNIYHSGDIIADGELAEEQLARLTVKVSGVDGAVMQAASVYHAGAYSVTLELDGTHEANANFALEGALTAIFTVNKKAIDPADVLALIAPEKLTLTYTGIAQRPADETLAEIDATFVEFREYDDEALYTAQQPASMTAVGEYTLSLKLNNTADYVFEGNVTTVAITWTIEKAKVAKPMAGNNRVNSVDGAYTYVPDGFNAEIMEISGNTARKRGEYTATVTLKDTANYEWADGSAGALTLEWTALREVNSAFVAIVSLLVALIIAATAMLIITQVRKRDKNKREKNK